MTETIKVYIPVIQPFPTIREDEWDLIDDCSIFSLYESKEKALAIAAKKAEAYGSVDGNKPRYGIYDPSTGTITDVEEVCIPNT